MKCSRLKRIFIIFQILIKKMLIRGYELFSVTITMFEMTRPEFFLSKTETTNFQDQFPHFVDRNERHNSQESVQGGTTVCKREEKSDFIS